MAKKALPLSAVYRLLEPGPVVMVATAARGRTNIMTMSWHMMMEFVPPLVGCIVSGHNYTYDLLRASRECVINVPAVELATKVVRCGNTSGRKIDKFKSFGLTPVASSRVKAPRIEECHANLECKVVDTRMMAKYNMFVLEVVKAWIDPSVARARTVHHAGHGIFHVAGEMFKLPSKKK